MLIVNEIQRSLYDRLKSENSQNFRKLTGIFNYLDKNMDFPYIFMDMSGMKNLSTFSETIYLYSTSIDIYDKNTSNSFVINLAEEIKNIFDTITNFKMNNLEMIDIVFNGFTIALEADNTIWKGELLYDIIVKKNVKIKN